jgi:two-component system NtrC family sensor kinase
MAAGIAHELRNPLNVINSAAYYIKSKIGEDPKLQRNIEHMEREIGRADALITSLLEFSKPVTKIEQVKVNRLLDDALLLLGKEVSFHNIEIVKEYDGALPSIEGERNRLESVFLNIILNAVQAMPDGGRLSLKTRRAGEESIEILFADTGTGIEKEDLHKIFDPFFSRKEKGVGLGLSISAQAIRAHGGEISVESRPGEGTTFSIRLPIKKEG